MASITEAYVEEYREEKHSEDIDCLSLYLQDIAQWNFLTRDDEAQLSRRIQAGRAALLLRDEPAVEAEKRHAAAIALAEVGFDPQVPLTWRNDAALAPIEAGHCAERVRDQKTPQERVQAIQRLFEEAPLSAGARMLLRASLPEFGSDDGAGEGIPASLAQAIDAALETLISSMERQVTALSEKITSLVLASDRLPVVAQALDWCIGDGQDARAVLVERNLRLVVSMAKRYTGQGLDIEDLISFGNMGLISAAEKFDWHRNTRFSTYASFWIHQAIVRGLSSSSRFIYLPSYMVDRQLRLKRRVQELTAELGREPTQQDLATALDITVNEVRLLFDHMQPVTSLERPVADDESELVLSSLIPDPDIDVEEEASQVDLREVFKSIYDTVGLSKRDREMLRKRYSEDYTLDMIADQHDLTRERVRQVLHEIEGKIAPRLQASPVIEYQTNGLDATRKKPAARSRRGGRR